MFATRVARLRQRLHEEGFTHAALVPGPNLMYFFGLSMHLSERPIVVLVAVEDERPLLIAPSFEVGKVEAATPAFAWRIYSYRDGQPYSAAFHDAAHVLGGAHARIVVEPTRLRALEWSLLTRALPHAELAATEAPFAALRQIKDAHEIALLREAARRADQVLEALLPELRLGLTEKQVARKLLGLILDAESDGMPFAPLVQSGPTAANPHAEAGARVLQCGDLLLLDFGVCVQGYASDITRTVALGEPTAELRAAYEAVKAANAAARAIVKPGLPAEAVDRAAREVIEAAGFGRYFTHRTGHGLGLEGHEAPYIVEGNITPLQPGMVFTIEPGIYLPGKGGVRIEDDVAVTDHGCESLTTSSRELVVLPC